MPRILIATDQPNPYPQGLLAKSGESLREIARSVKQIPVVWGSHSGRQCGLASGLEFRDDRGVGKLYAVVSSKIPEGWGASLQYSGNVIDSVIKMAVDRSLHLAIVPNPRDARTVYSDSESNMIFRDSVETVIENTNTGPVTVEVPKTDEAPEVKTGHKEPESNSTVEVPPEMVTAILSNSQFIEKIVAGLAAHMAPQTPETTEPKEEPKAPTTPKITYRVPAPTPSPQPRSRRPEQQKPKALN